MLRNLYSLTISQSLLRYHHNHQRITSRESNTFVKDRTFFNGPSRCWTVPSCQNDIWIFGSFIYIIKRWRVGAVGKDV